MVSATPPLPDNTASPHPRSHWPVSRSGARRVVLEFGADGKGADKGQEDDHDDEHDAQHGRTALVGEFFLDGRFHGLPPFLFVIAHAAPGPGAS
jgi:hypothetical protein